MLIVAFPADIVLYFPRTFENQGGMGQALYFLL